MNNNFKKIILFLGDIAVLYFSLYLTLVIRYLEQPTSGMWQQHLWPFSIIFVFWILIFYIADLYNLHMAVNNSKFFQITVRSIIIASAFSAVFFYITSSITIAPKTNLVIYLIVVTCIFIFWRRLFNWLLGSYLPKNHIAIIGYNKQAQELIKELKEKPHLGYKIVLLVNKEVVGQVKVLTLDKIDKLKQAVIDNKISNIIITSDIHQSPEIRSSLFSCLPLGVTITNLPNFYEMVTGKVPIEAINQTWFLENLNEGEKAWFNTSKRIFDIALSLIILIITLPFWIIIGLIIKLESKGPVFFKQIRAGKNSQPFTMIKFRTMTEDGNDRSLTTANDKRITPFGKFLRKTRLDEIPQVLNMLMGEMSFVGPRPERPEFIEQLKKQIPFYEERMLVKPGLTGWDQVSGEYHSASEEDTLKKLQYDLFYIKNRSSYLDLSIILKTIAIVFKRGGV